MGDAFSQYTPISDPRRSSVGRFSQSYWTKELSIGKRQNGNSGQFGSGVGPRRKHNRDNPKLAKMLGL